MVAVVYRGGKCRARDADFTADEEKKRYFKILPNHVAPQGVKYSQEGLRKERTLEKVGLAVSLVFAMLRLEFLGMRDIPYSASPVSVVSKQLSIPRIVESICPTLHGLPNGRHFTLLSLTGIPSY